MFGDIGHGFIVFSIGVTLCLLNPILKVKVPSMEGILAMRYLLLLLGFFATFCGIIYNDFMSIPIFVFDSCYPVKESELARAHNHTEIEMI